MKLAIIANYFGPEKESIPKIAEIGFDTIEIRRKEWISMKTDDLVQMCKSYGIDSHSIMGGDPNLVSMEKVKRKQAIQSLKENIKWANTVGAKIMETVPGYGERAREKNEIIADIIQVLKEIGKYAEDYGVTLAIEPCTKAETFFMSTIRDAANIAREVNSEAIKVMGDTSHMHVEERDPVKAILDAKEWIVHMHFSDNNRLPPGLGQMNLKGIINALYDITYEGSLSLSEVSFIPDKETAAKLSYEYVRCLMKIGELRKSLG